MAELVDLDLSQDLSVSALEESIYVGHAGMVYETPSERRRMQSAGMKIHGVESTAVRCYSNTPQRRHNDGESIVDERVLSLSLDIVLLILSQWQR